MNITERIAAMEDGGAAETALVVAAALALTLVVLLRADLCTYAHPCFALPWDHHKYLHMASAPLGSFHIAPYCWRLGVPLVASLLPLSLQANFLALAVACVALTGICLYYLARRIGYARRLALVAMFMFFSLRWGPGFVLADFWLPDSAGFLLTCAALWCLLAGRDGLFAVVLALGVMVKESVLFTLPLYYTLRCEHTVDLPLARRTLVVAAPALLVLVMVRLLVPALNANLAYVSGLPESLSLVQRLPHQPNSMYSYGVLLREVGLPHLAAMTWKSPWFAARGSFGTVLTLLALCGALRSPSWPSGSRPSWPWCSASYSWPSITSAWWWPPSRPSSGLP